jgi:adenylate kinase
MHKYIVMGPQGSGKGTQASLLCRSFDLVHISVGDILRWHIQAHTKLGARVKRIVASGQLVPDEIVDDVVRNRLEQHDWNYGFVLDGFPRNVAQARFFLETYDVDAVLLIEVPDAVVTERILSRRLCAACGLDYNLIHHRPAELHTCDVCRGRLVSRMDDTPEAIAGRLRDYRDKVRPILELFLRKGGLIMVDGTAAAESVQAEVRRKLGFTRANTRTPLTRIPAS